MNAVELFAELKARGIQLQAHGNRLRYYPASQLTKELREQMLAHKAELLALVRFDVVLPISEQSVTGALGKCGHCSGLVFVGQLYCDYCGAYFIGTEGWQIVRLDSVRFHGRKYPHMDFTDRFRHKQTDPALRPPNGHN